MENNFPKLFIPGPTHVSKEILEEFSTDQIGHRTPEISTLIDYIVDGVKEILYTNNQIFFSFSCSYRSLGNGYNKFC